MEDRTDRNLGPAVDSELASALAAMPKAANGKLMDLTDIPALQRLLRETGKTLEAANPPDPRVRIDTITLLRADGSALAVRRFRPADATGPLPALLWCHAGGQVVGSAEEDGAYHARLALELQALIAVVDYRLAPQTPAPGGAQDALTAYVDLIDRATEHGVDPEHVGIAGASGGGAIAAATALMVRDRGLRAPCLLSLSYPMLDDRNETPSSHQITDLGIWDRQENLLAWQAVLGERAGTQEVEAYSAPGRARDLRGFPPAFVAVGQLDLFRDEDIDFARRLVAGGVPVELHVYPAAFHAFDRFAPASRLAVEFERTWSAFLRRHLHG